MSKTVYQDLSVDTIANALSYVSADCDRETWWKMAAAIKSELGADGFAIWDEWSKNGASYNARDAKDTWKSSHGTGGVGIGSLIYEAQRNGFTFESKPKEITPAERDARKAKRDADAAKELAAIQRKQKLAAQIAREIWDKAEPIAYNFHPYHTRKSIMFCGDVRIGDYPRWTPDGIITIQKALLIPIRNRLGELTSLQAIFADTVPELGRDRDYLPNGVKQGSFFTLGEYAGDIYICEGYATGCSIHEAMDAMTVVAFDRSNLIEVGKIMRDLYPDANIDIAADNDKYNKRGNDGLTSATKAAAACGGVLRVPQFKDETEKPTDFNDLERLEGLDTVQRQLRGIEQQQPELPTPTNDNIPPIHFDEFTPFLYVTGNGKPKAVIENVEDLLRRMGAVVRYNVIAKDVEILIPGHSASRDNRLVSCLSHIISKCNLVGIPTGNLEGFLTTIADRNQYNPVLTWVNSKPWDGVKRWDEFCNTITPKTVKPLPDGTPLHIALIKRWMVSAIAAASRDGTSLHGALVLQGDQGLGKTSWLKSLAPSSLDIVKDGLSLNPDNKDSVKKVISFWLVELGEVNGTLKKSDQEALKAFLTKDSDEIRLPYARAESDFGRRTAFFGSVNPKTFLKDDTGSRRWWVIECESIDYQHTFDMQQVWAEVRAAYESGMQWHLTKDEDAALNASNEEFQVIDPIEERILSHLQWDTATSSWRWITATDLLIDLGIDKPTRAETMKAASCIRKHNGCQQTRRSNGQTLMLAPKLAPPEPIHGKANADTNLGW